MNIYKEHLTDDDLNSLKEVIGLSISHLYSSRIHSDLKDKKISMPNCVIPIEDEKFMNISYEWNDTPNEYLDYYMIDFSVSYVPKFIESTEVEEIESFDGSSIYFGESFVKEINVLYFTESHKDEKVIYDCGISIHFDDGCEIILGLDFKNAGELIFIHENLAVENFKNNSSIRSRITSEGVS